MTSASRSPRTAPPRRNFARARLYLGISGVGAAVVLASSLLIVGVPSQWLSDSASQPLLQAVGTVLLALAFGSLVFLPFDLLGGAGLVRRTLPPAQFFTQWLRGVAMQLLVWTISATCLLAGARWADGWGALAAFTVLQVLLAATRAPLARLIAPMPRCAVSPEVASACVRVGLDPGGLVIVKADDEGFVGGWTGIRARALLVPFHWTTLPSPALAAALQRRRVIRDSGAHVRGVLGAIAWNTLGFALLIQLLPLLTRASLSSASGLATMALGMTLWTFLSVLVLPTPSRAAVFAVDAASLEASRGSGQAADAVAAMGSAIEQLDRWQDDEPTRSRGVETIFHPVPARSTRLARLRGAVVGASVAPWHMHHVARHALWLSWASLTPLSRAVHCNVGRPALWAMLPGD